jgi:hypothetical protein
LSTFVTALKIILNAETEGYVVVYIDVILIYSGSFEEYLLHLGTVIGELA